MQIDINRLSIVEIFRLSKYIKEKCGNLSSFEEVAQELTRILYSSFVTEDEKSPFVLVRFFKSCSYGELSDKIKNYIHNKEWQEHLSLNSRYLTLLGSYGEQDNWRHRNHSENYKAFPIHDEHMLEKFPMLSAVFDQIGLKHSHLKQTDKSIIINDYHKQYGVFCVENAEGNKLIPKQAEFVKPFSVKSVFGFGGIYSTSNVYAVLVFSRARLSKKNAHMFLSLNPAIRQMTLEHEITGNIFVADGKETLVCDDGLNDKTSTGLISPQNNTISLQNKDLIEREIAISTSIELEMSNDYLLQLSESLKNSHEQLEDRVKERTQELNESRDQFQLLLNSTGEAIYGIDNNGSCTFVNKTCLDVLGYEDDSQLLGKNMHNMIHHTRENGAPYPVEECCIYQAFREGKGTHVDTEVLWRNDKTSFPAEYRSHPIIKSNKTIGAVVTFSDITERRKAENHIKTLNETLELKVNERTRELMEKQQKLMEEVIQRKKAEESAESANMSKSRFLTSMSHELRTPLNSVLGFAQLLYSDSDAPLSESQKEDMGHILQSGNHLLELINEVLDLSGIESGKVQISLEEIEVDTAINEVIVSVEPIAEENKIVINYRAENDGQYIMADNTRLKQVLINLLSNAIKYNSDGGSVSIWIESPTDKMLRVNIEDTGPGIAKENHDSLFEPFNRLGAESLNVEGTGVGLTITKKLVEMMGGSIGVESEVGKGAKFYVDFVKANSPAFISGKKEGVMAEKYDTEKTKRCTILYVEDNPTNLKLVESILQRRPDIDLLTAPEAQLGVEFARAHCPDIILMDINLPGMDGYEALELLKSFDQTKEIPVIALSANAMPKDIERGIASGFVEYLTKPINVDKFLKQIDTILMKTKK